MQDNASPQQTEQRRRGRRTMWLLLAVSLAPIVAAWVSYYAWQPSARRNYGELLTPPVALAGMEALRGKWVLLLVAPAACEASCQQDLHNTRQLHTALGKEMSRVTRAWLVSDGQVLQSTDSALQVLHNEKLGATLQTGRVYLVDPLGNLIMRYPNNPEPQRMMKDLNQLLKYSPLGRS